MQELPLVEGPGSLQSFAHVFGYLAVQLENLKLKVPFSAQVGQFLLDFCTPLFLLIDLALKLHGTFLVQFKQTLELQLKKSTFQL